MTKIFRAKLTIAVTPANPVLDTKQLFDASYREGAGSAIDEFLMRLKTINRLAPQPQSFEPVQAQLVLLGTIAAVESYLRTVFRKVISFDTISQECVHKKDVTFGAALHLSKELLPEAILERISFISKDSIQDAMKDLLGIKGEIPPELGVSINAYVRVCQLRHCAVHRFGKLGANNAIALGLADHLNLLEKPLLLNYASLQDAILIAKGLVVTINNIIYSALVSRISWSWDYSVDRPIYIKYHAMFADTVSQVRSLSPKSMYTILKQQNQKFIAKIPF